MPAPSAVARVASIDILRGAIMALMAIDHVRVFSGVPAGGPLPAVFFTRWITHFCAPGFVFFAGSAAYLHGQRLGNRAALARWLLARGAWLIFLELTVMRLSWTFNLDFRGYELAGVLWVIGLSLLCLSGLIFLPRSAVAAFGIAVIALHNLTDFAPQLGAAAQGSALAPLWKLLYFGFGAAIGDGPRLVVLYTLFPWVGVMAAGFAFGPILRASPEERRRLCLLLGGGAILAFLLLRGLDLYGDPRPWRHLSAAAAARLSAMPVPLRFLNTSKYPASLLFLLMTLGPLVLLIPLLERARGPVARLLALFGRVPLFYYVLHIPLIHALALLVSLLREGRVSPWLFENHPMMMSQAPPGYPWSLGLLYLVWAVTIALLVLPCRWFAALKQRSDSPFLRLW